MIVGSCLVGSLQNKSAVCKFSLLLSYKRSGGFKPSDRYLSKDDFSSKEAFFIAGLGVFGNNCPTLDE